MTENLFIKVDYTVASLLSKIELGELALPNIQRPFVWNKVKARDLLDSMYKGYPIGYLLFWQNGLVAHQTIGVDDKQKPPSLVIVDGQQRLTSLYAVLKGVPVKDKNYKDTLIQIAFNPIERRFEVADAAIMRDRTFIPNISHIWNPDIGPIKVINEYVDNLTLASQVDTRTEKAIQDAILRLDKLSNFPLIALELQPQVSEEDVSNVFVRINSKGTPLNQADFILTLMSVFWDDGRTELEQFCRETKRPPTGGPSPFNYIIRPSADRLLRVSVALAFSRARLNHVYSILRGKDLETEEFSDERREQQFEVLKEAQKKVLDLKHWHGFIKCVRQAGYLSERMITSQTNLLYSYVLYLMGRTRYGISEDNLRSIIGRWFFMSSLTGRYTASPESTFEFDLARLRECGDQEKFIWTLRDVCESVLTPDFWRITLPNALATSSPRSPSLFAYIASLVVLNARTLFSRLPVNELIDPAIWAKRAAIERHHLFPKGYLKTLGITNIRETNQIANYALIEWSDNAKISDRAPAEYLPELTARLGKDELSRMYHWHALPDNWEHLEYHEFLQQRRVGMAQIIQEGYRVLAGETKPKPIESEINIEQLVSSGESEVVEFKATLRRNLHTGINDPRMEHAILKSLAGFLNTNGGTLFVGVADDGSPVGIKADGFSSEDSMALHLVNIVKSRMGAIAMTGIHVHFEDYNSHRVMVVRCGKAHDPVYLKDGHAERFYVRTGPSTTELTPSQTVDYISRHFQRK